MFPKRKHITCADNAAFVNYNQETGLGHSILYEPSPVDEFYREPQTNEDGSESISFIDPIYVLFNQQRLNDLGATAVKAFLDSLQPKSDALAELRSKCSDDDLMQMVKSRHLQSPAEILTWCRYMQNNVDQFNAEVQKLVEAQNAQQAQNVTINEQSNTE